ncbi:unnamed protein product [Phytomonas sp. EM1]|nr:unnamed protein product [Phytomonas sp. EM1]|eukprot:CCW63754.1 unnamed protein product [Phytomonas sp. isolate EM1]
MIQWHQEQLTTLERRLAEWAEEQDVRWRAFGEDVERRMREIGDAHGSITDSNPAKAPHRGGDWMKEAEERAVGVDDDDHAASAASVKPLKEALLALEQQLGEVATSSEVGLKATADALTGLRDSLQQCVSCVKQELRGDSLMLRIIKGGEVPLSPSAVLPSQCEPNANDEATLEALPKLEALDEVFVLFMRQLSYVCHGLATLQENAFATLELVQQQEMSILAIPTLQEAVLQLASQLKRVSVALPELGEWNSGIEEVMQSTMLRSQEIEIDEQ